MAPAAPRPEADAPPPPPGGRSAARLPARRPLGRRRVLRLAAGGILAPLAAVAGWGAWTKSRPGGEDLLLSEGVAVGAGGVLHPLAPGASCTFVAGTRVPDAASRSALALGEAEADGLAAAAAARASARLPSTPRADMARCALADLLALTGPVLARDLVAAAPPGASTAPSAAASPPVDGDATAFPPGAVVAGPVGIWRYSWPRDASFAAAALSAVGLGPEAAGVLERLAAWQGEDGSFEARYDADGRAPDERPAQTDGTGWVVWAAERVVADVDGRAQTAQREQDDGQAQALLARLGPLVAASAPRLLALTDRPDHLPAVSPDYWEKRESRLTLGAALPVLIGLEAAARLVERGMAVGADPAALEQRAALVRAAVEDAFAPAWGRYAGGREIDAALAFAGPPFTAPMRGWGEARRAARARLAQPAGGLNPGEQWHSDGVSWTPETALMAWSALASAVPGGAGADGAGSGEAGAAELRREGEELLDWLDGHRTEVGALSEKVRPDGAPAGPAPLAWTSALVLLAEMQRAAG